MQTTRESTRSRLRGGILLAVVVLLVVAGVILARIASPRPILSDLRAPRGLTALSDGSVLIAEVLGGRLLRRYPDETMEIVVDDLPATLGGPTNTYPTGISAAAHIDTYYYYIVGEFRGRGYSSVYRVAPGETPEIVAGGVGRDGFPTTPITNPYDLVPAPDGGLFVSDGGANAVFHVSLDGTISEYATFSRRTIPDVESYATVDVVPTGLTHGPDGALYVASLTGIPYPSGAAQVYRLEDINGDGDALDDGETTVYADGFSVATDVAFDTDGSLLVTEFSRDMPRLVRTYSLDQAARVPGRLLRWQDGRRSVVAHRLVSPTAVTVVDGRIFVSEEFAGRVTEIRSVRDGVVGWLPFVFEAGLVLIVALAVVVRGLSRTIV